ncbi:unnamed protein product [Lampetra planeri]
MAARGRLDRPTHPGYGTRPGPLQPRLSESHGEGPSGSELPRLLRYNRFSESLGEGPIGSKLPRLLRYNRLGESHVRCAGSLMAPRVIVSAGLFDDCFYGQHDKGWSLGIVHAKPAGTCHGPDPLAATSSP